MNNLCICVCDLKTLAYMANAGGHQFHGKPFIMWTRDDQKARHVYENSDDVLAKLLSLGNPVVMSPDHDWMIGLTGEVATAVNIALSHKGGEDDQRVLSTVYLAGLLPGVQIDTTRYVL